MIALHDDAPAISVPTAEYVRLLGYPRGWTLEGRALELAEGARAWYARHGRPWLVLREIGPIEPSADGVRIDGHSFASLRLARLVREAGAVTAVVAAISAGPELEAEAQRLWQDEKPDEYFFLEVYGSAVVEHLVTAAGARLCAWADPQGLAVLPHDSPGYPEWTIADQSGLLATLVGSAGARQRLALDALDSGMLRPKKSLLAVFGLTRMTERVRALTTLTPCEHCAYTPCAFRRAAYRRTPSPVDPELASGGPDTSEVASPLDAAARYSVHAKALRRWAGERLTLETDADGRVRARFRYEGTTCTNMGRALVFDYHVMLAARTDGYRILEQRCEPGPDDRGHQHMCRYLTDATSLMQAIRDERPLAGRPLNDVIGWARASAPAGCYCEPHSRTYKWGLVLETLHFALAQQDATTLRETTS